MHIFKFNDHIVWGASARTLKQIMDILGVDEFTAKVYRAALWNMVKAKEPPIVGNLEKHIEMEKMITEETLKGIKKPIRKHLLTSTLQIMSSMLKCCLCSTKMTPT